MNKDEKKIKVMDIYDEQLLYMRKTIAVCKLPEPKRPSTKMKRAFRVVAYAMKIKQLELQKQIVISQPILEGYVGGGNAIFGDLGQEIITDRNGKLYSLVKPIIIDQHDAPN